MAWKINFSFTQTGLEKYHTLEKRRKKVYRKFILIAFYSENILTWNTVTKLHNNESKFLRSHTLSSFFISQNLHPNRFMPRILNNDYKDFKYFIKETKNIRKKGEREKSIWNEGCGRFLI